MSGSHSKKKIVFLQITDYTQIYVREPMVFEYTYNLKQFEFI